MRGARISTTLLIGVVSSVVCWVLLDSWTGQGNTAPPLSWTAVFGTVALVVVVIAAGLPMRRWQRTVPGERVGMKRRIDPLVAARTAVLAKAAAYGGALILGWYLGQALILLPDLVGDRLGRFVLAMIAAGSAVALSAAGFVVQRWCRVPPDDDEKKPD
ncbi:DUF3180 domain-containing protein [Kineosporia sp. NBRC 101731]|uniref:DUF3180 domain-containing protein n=1 Tax=Kineosporia sp. NBRC 101731 TaxID=3032199 RepID=UPI0024A176E8|nr:DUF3180 domain-containing protein [Kineosporia sp. NBRC 101731]GLY27547.1 hypothetical protein Kisp02_09120 [Kineosporia sp. NBRC 101731]